MLKLMASSTFKSAIKFGANINPASFRAVTEYRSFCRRSADAVGTIPANNPVSFAVPAPSISMSPICDGTRVQPADFNKPSRIRINATASGSENTLNEYFCPANGFNWATRVACCQELRDLGVLIFANSRLASAAFCSVLLLARSRRLCGRQPRLFAH
jgi:hypothetical protein